jgi:hypothetical protein
VGEKITVTSGPNRGNQIIFMATPEGVIFEFIQLGE